MALPYVCSTCSRQTARRLWSVSGRQRRYASSNTMGRLLDGLETDQVTTTLAQSDDHIRQSRRNANSRQENTPNVPTWAARSTVQRQPEELLGYIDRPQRQPRRRQPRTEGSNDGKAGEETEDAFKSASMKLRNMLSAEDKDMEEIWDFFRQNFASRSFTAMVRPAFDTAQVRGSVFGELLKECTRVWCQYGQNDTNKTSIPSPLEVLDQLREIGLASPGMHQHLMWIMSSRLQLELSRDRRVFRDPKAVQTIDQLMTLLSQWLKGGWLNQDRVELRDASRSYRLLSTSQYHAKKGRSRTTPSLANHIAALIPAFAVKDEGRLTEGMKAILCMYDTLTHGLEQPARLAEYEPFVTDMKRILLDCRVEMQSIRILKGNMKHAGLDEESTKSFLARLIRKSATPESMTQELSFEVGLPVEIVADDIITRLARALEQQNLDRADKIWTKTQQFLDSEDVRNSNHPDVIKLYEHFLITYLTLRKPNSALAVWNNMITHGFAPTVETWTVMLKGCQVNHDTASLEDLWRKMRRSGIQPDIYAWTTRIFGLFRANWIELGLRALDEMGKEWTTSTRKTKTSSLSSAPKPNTEILNAAVSALASQRSEHIARVLSWSRHFDISPNVITYNVLINVSLAQGRPAEASALLARMASSNIAPDAATFTILLNALFVDQALGAASPSDQEEQIFAFIASVETAGLSVDQRSYALIIDRLTKESGNMDLVLKVLAHMSERGIQPTAYIYTILMTHYFSLSPPDLAGIDSLWAGITARRHYEEVLDVIFYDRMVEGYARVGDVGKMMMFLTRMGREGKRAGWLALGEVVRCLASQGRWETVRQVVRDVESESGLLREGVRGRKGQMEFAELVAEVGRMGRLD